MSGRTVFRYILPAGLGLLILLAIVTLLHREDVTLANGKVKEVKFTVGQKRYFTDGQVNNVDVAPFIQNGRTYVPVCYLAEALGASVDPESATRTVTLTKGAVEVRLVIGGNTITVNGKSRAMDVAPLIRNERTFLPARYVAEAFGYQVGWDANTQTVTITGVAPEQGGYLLRAMDQFHTTFDVYTDSHAAGNHFAARGRMSSPGDEDAVVPMDEDWTNNPHSGATCIRCAFEARGSNWGGWYFMNGVLRGNDAAPRENWGDEPGAGFDLWGATKLTFWARGARGGERVKFFAFGIGRDPYTAVPLKPYPDSSPKVSTGYVVLSAEWKQYTIDLAGRDLSYVLGGFGWITSAPQNNNHDITFYLDDIRYDKARPDEPRFLVSYATIPSTQDFDVVMRNVAFTYDNAVALLAFLASGDVGRAKLLADALVYAQQHDRFYTDGRLRNAYQGGDLVLPPGWTPNGKAKMVRMPGFWDSGQRKWYENKFQVSTHTGNVGWAMLALLAYHEATVKTGNSPYLEAVQRMGEWVERSCRDARGAGGYTAGFEGWELAPTKLTYKATEHNIDLYVAFQRLYLITGDERWRERASHAKRFVLAMWDDTEGKFWTGTRNDGVTINKDVVPLDIQAWAVLALEEGEGKPYWKALEYAGRHQRVGKGFDFDTDCDGIWYEGTAHMALAYHFTGQEAKWRALVDFLRSAQHEGGLPAADKDGLTTGFDWFYFRRLHVGATAWLILAEYGVNPFWFGKAEKVSGEGGPAIEFVHVPAYGSFEDLKGRVRGVRPEAYRVAVYIYVVGGWWTKPYWDRPLTVIRPDGTWTCDITTGGVDQQATRIAAYLVPAGYNPPLARGGATLPRELEEKAVTGLEVPRSP